MCYLGSVFVSVFEWFFLVFKGEEWGWLGEKKLVFGENVGSSMKGKGRGAKIGQIQILRRKNPRLITTHRSYFLFCSKVFRVNAFFHCETVVQYFKAKCMVQHCLCLKCFWAVVYFFILQSEISHMFFSKASKFSAKKYWVMPHYFIFGKICPLNKLKKK